jgi:hypothetical protein
VFIGLMTFLVAWGNFITSAVDSTVKNVLKVDPTKIYDDYQKALQMQKAAEGEKSWWEKAFEWRSSLLEAILTGIFFFFGWIAGALVWWAYLGASGAVRAGAISAATAFESLGAASISGGYGGSSLIGTLAEMQGPTPRRQRESGTQSFPLDDPTGDKTVAQLIRKTRNPYSSEG